MVAPLYGPEPSDILNHPHNTDGTVMAEIMSQSNIKEIWETPDSDFTKDERLFYYWRKRLRHLLKKYIRRLFRRGVLPKALEHVRRMPFCAACSFADASKRNWRVKSKHKDLRKSTDERGSKTSCDHLISHEPGIIAQVTGRLTYERYCGAIIFSDHYSDFTYTHIVQSTSTEEAVYAKKSYPNLKL